VLPGGAGGPRAGEGPGAGGGPAALRGQWWTLAQPPLVPLEPPGLGHTQLDLPAGEGLRVRVPRRSGDRRG